MARLTIYSSRRTFKEPFSPCRLRAASAVKLFAFTEGTQHMECCLEGVETPCQDREPAGWRTTLLPTLLSGWDLLVGCEMWCPALRGRQDCVVTLGEPAAPCLLHRPGKQAGG